MAGAMSLEDFLRSPCARIMDEVDEANETGITLGDLRSSKATVYDFWTTRCTNCPDALERLDSISRQRGSINFVGVNIDDIVKARQLLQEATSAGRWTRLTHVHLGEEAKEQVKEVLHMRTVPFYVVVGKEGNVLGHGNAKTLPLKTAEALDAVLMGKKGEEKQDLQTSGCDDATPGASAGENQKIDPGDANMQPSDADPVKANDSMCEGGVCRLPRRPKVNSESNSRTRAPASKPSSEPARVSRGNTSEDKICELKRVEIRGGEPVTSGPRASVECEGNVCRLVRKTSVKVAEGKGDAAASNPAQCIPGTREDEAPLGVGDRLSTLQVVEIGGAEVPAARPLDQVIASGPAVLDFWTTRCVRCPAALDGLESLAKTSAMDGELSNDEPNREARYTYVSVNLDSLQEARTMVADGRWPSIAHVFAGRDEDAARLEVFKRRIGLKSVPFYVVIDADGRIEQVGGPTAVDLSKTTTPLRSTCPAQRPDGPAEDRLGSRSVISRSPEQSKPSFVFTIDEDF